MKIILISMFLGFTALAAEEAETVHKACRADIELNCKGIKQGGGRIAKCLKENESHLSPECIKARTEKKEAIKEKMQKRREEVKEACKAEKEKFCKEVTGPIKVVRCLREHESEKDFSSTCKESLPAKRK